MRSSPGRLERDRRRDGCSVSHGAALWNYELPCTAPSPTETTRSRQVEQAELKLLVILASLFSLAKLKQGNYWAFLISCGPVGLKAYSHSCKVSLDLSSPPRPSVAAMALLGEAADEFEQFI